MEKKGETEENLENRSGEAQRADNRADGERWLTRVRKKCKGGQK